MRTMLLMTLVICVSVLGMSAETINIPANVVDCGRCHGIGWVSTTYEGLHNVPIRAKTRVTIRALCTSCDGVGKVATTGRLERTIKLPRTEQSLKLEKDIEIEHLEADANLLQETIKVYTVYLENTKKRLESAKATKEPTVATPTTPGSTGVKAPSVQCPECKGTGKGNAYQKCLGCRGTSKTPCPTCKGDWRIKCAGCNGQGKVYSADFGGGYVGCQKCKGYGLFKCATCTEGAVMCTVCNGTGMTAKTCVRCSGVGVVEKSEGADNF